MAQPDLLHLSPVTLLLLTNAITLNCMNVNYVRLTGHTATTGIPDRKIFATMIRMVIGSGLYIIAGTSFTIWLIQYFGFNSGDSIHILLVTAIVALLVKTCMHLPTGDREKDLET